MNAAILLCAGTGKRMQGIVFDKILTPMAGIPVVCHSINAFIRSATVDQFTLVYRDEAQQEAIAQALTQSQLNGQQVTWTLGGAERQDSVYHALLDLSPPIENVFIHDCARPLIHPHTLKHLLQAVQQDKAAVVAHRVTDTIKQAGSPTKTAKRHLQDVPRADLWAMETPQAFNRELITAAYRHIRANRLHVTDDTAAASQQGHPVTLVENPFPNPKLTVPADLEYLEFLFFKRKGTEK